MNDKINIIEETENYSVDLKEGLADAVVIKININGNVNLVMYDKNNPQDLKLSDAEIFMSGIEVGIEACLKHIKDME